MIGFNITNYCLRKIEETITSQFKIFFYHSNLKKKNFLIESSTFL